MATRHIKRLQQQLNASKQDDEPVETSEEEESEDLEHSKPPFNPFDLLEDDDDQEVRTNSVPSSILQLPCILHSLLLSTGLPCEHLPDHSNPHAYCADGCGLGRRLLQAPTAMKREKMDQEPARTQQQRPKQQHHKQPSLNSSKEPSQPLRSSSNSQQAKAQALQTSPTKQAASQNRQQVQMTTSTSC